MNATLLSECECDTQGTLPLTALPDPKSDDEQNSSVVPEDVTRYSAIWAASLQAFNNYQAAVEAIMEMEKSAWPDRESYQYITPGADESPIKELHSTVVGNLCRKAEKDFAVPGSTLQISPSDLENVAAAEFEKFDAVAVWQYLDRKFNSDEGKTASYLLASKALSSAIEISPYRRDKDKQEIKVVTGRPVLTLHVYGEWEYNFSGRETLIKFLEALRCVAIWGEIYNFEDEEAFEALKNVISRRGVKDPRAWGKIDYWPLATMVPFKEKIEFRILPALAEKLQVFVATYPISRF